MAVSIDTYNKAFKAFTDFALERVNANDGKAIASAKIDAPLGGRKMLAVKHTTADSVHNWTRGFDQWTVNDRTRNLFRQTVAGMFGGESRIPESVKKAMLLDDYGKGKPLTARRITEVKNAIEAFANEAKASADQAIEKLFRSRVFFKEMPQNESDKLKRIVTDIYETCDSAMAREVMGENIVAIYGEIGFPPPDANGKFGEAMLQANHLFGGTDGAVLCQNPETFAYALFRPFPLPSMDVETFCGHVGKLVDQVEGWKRLMEGFRDAEDDAEDAAEEAATFDATTAAGAFMRV